MLKASALYIVIIISLVIGLLCSSLIAAAYFYRLQYQKTFRYDKLRNNLGSGINILIANQDTSYALEKTLSLFSNGADSVSLQKIGWGVFDIAIAKSFIQKDTLYRTFSLANTIDSAKWGALYLIDEDRPLSVSGKTTIKGRVYIPKAGVKDVYVDGKAYEGDKRLVIGEIQKSAKKLPELSAVRLKQLEQNFNQILPKSTRMLTSDSLKNSFLSPTQSMNFGKNMETLSHISLSGNIILFSDTTVIVDRSTELNNILIFARSIVVKAGFHGTCQLFATDSLRVEHDCVFDYPSCLAVVRFKMSDFSTALRLFIGENTSVSGLVFTYDKIFTASKQPYLELGKNAIITGQVYSQGILALKDGINIQGGVFTTRFLYQPGFTGYENYLINATLNESALSPYYLGSDLLPVAAGKKKVLQWLEAN